MRKFFLIALLVALIPFTTGCRVGGLWGYDDDTGTTLPTGPGPVVNANTVKLAVVVPPAVSGNVLAAITAEDKLSLTGFVRVTSADTAAQMHSDNHSWHQMDKVTDANGQVTFSISIAGNLLDLNGVNAVYKFTTLNDTYSVTVPLTIAATTTDTPTTVYYAAQVAFTNETTASVTPYTGVTSINFTTITTTGFVSTGAVAGTSVPVPLTPTTTTYIQVAGVKIGPDGKSLSFDKAFPTILGVENLQNVKFEVEFAEDVTNSEDGFEVIVDNQNTPTTSTTITKTANSSDLTLAYANKKLTVTITKSVALIRDAIYQLTFKSSTAKAGTKVLDLPKYAYFRANGTALIDYTGKGSTAEQNQILSTSREIVLTFSGNLKTSQTVAGKVQLARYALDGSLEATYIIDQATFGNPSTGSTAASQLILTANQDFVAGKKYVVTWLAGTLLDENSVAVEIHSPITFYTK